MSGRKAGARGRSLELAGTGRPRPEASRADPITRTRIHAALHRLQQADGDLLLRDLADSAGMSPFHFLRVFKRETGVTPHQLVIRLRIARAVDLLRDTVWPSGPGHRRSRAVPGLVAL